jgi:hypothetical protein
LVVGRVDGGRDVDRVVVIGIWYAVQDSGVEIEENLIAFDGLIECESIGEFNAVELVALQRRADVIGVEESDQTARIDALTACQFEQELQLVA